LPDQAILFKILQARLRALSRCKNVEPRTRLQIGGLVVDPATREVKRAGSIASLTRTEFVLLDLLMRNAGRVITRARMIDAAWYFAGMVEYTLGRAYNNVGGTTTGGSCTSGINSFPANNYDLSGEWARADFDQKYRFNLLGTVTPGKYFKLGIALALYSGMPYSETTGLDNYNDGMATARPPGVPRNSRQDAGYADLDLRWSHDFFLASAKKDKGPTVTLGLDAFNIINHVNYMSYVGVLSSPLFGQPISAQPPRRLQVSFRFRF
jgi:hypothetical protein